MRKADMSAQKTTLEAFNIPSQDSQVALLQGSPETHFFDYFATLNNQDAQTLLTHKRHLFNKEITLSTEITKA